MRDGSTLWSVGETSTVEVREAIQNKLKIKQIIQNELNNDTEDESEKILSLYIMASTEQRAAMDALLVCICGETLSTIIEKAKEE